MDLTPEQQQRRRRIVPPAHLLRAEADPSAEATTTSSSTEEKPAQRLVRYVKPVRPAKVAVPLITPVVVAAEERPAPVVTVMPTPRPRVSAPAPRPVERAASVTPTDPELRRLLKRYVAEHGSLRVRALVDEVEGQLLAAALR